MCIDSVDGDYTVTNVDNISLARFHWLNQIHCLDLLDRRSLIAQIRSFQVLSPKAAGIRPSTHNWRGVRGLFYTPNWPVLQDTYRDLAALQILGGLDQIDKKACADGILRLHRGKGFFAAPDIEESWKFKIDGSARDTFCAFESLRILGALDRVHDLPEWKFRPWHKSDPRETPRQVTWEEIEAWLSARMLASLKVQGN
jgi:prenyltransferase beta subunit